MRPTYIKEGNLLYLVYQFKCFVLMCSVMADSLQTHHVPLSLEFSRQEYWSGFPFPSLGDLPDPGTDSASPALVGGFFASEPPGKTLFKFVSF